MITISRGYRLGVGFLVLIASIAASVPGDASSDPPLPDGRYVALGDSYSSGKGASSYETDNGRTDPCYRSYDAYPWRVTNQIAPSGFEFWACSGAHVYQLSSRAVSSDEPPFDDPAVVPSGAPYQSYLDRLDDGVTLVTLTIGGHDAGFGDVMFDCVQPFWFGTCDGSDAEVQEDLARLPGRLISVYRSIRAKVHPEARFLVLGYPQLFPDDPGGVCIDGGFINADERRWLNRTATQLNATIEESTAAVPGVEFVDVRPAFRGHEICGSSDAYLIGASIQHPSNSFHPNYKGHRAMADAVVTHLTTVPSPVAPPTPAPPPLPPAPPPVPPPPFVTDSVGAFEPTSGLWTLHYPEGTSDDFYYGIPGDVPLMGDWNCDGIDTVAMYRPSSGFVYLRQTNDFGIADRDFYFGIPGDIPVAGDWDGDGCDSLAIFRESEARLYVSNSLGTVAADFSFVNGGAGYRPFAGDFDGDGRDSVGFMTPTGVILHKNVLGPAPNDFGAYYGHHDHLLIAGDWDGDGDDTLGAYRPDGTLLLWNGWALGVADDTYEVGGTGSLPVAGTLSPSP